MNRNFLFLLIFLTGNTFLAAAQNTTSDENIIRQKIDNYYKGYLNNDATAIANAFDLTNGHLKARQKDSLTNKITVKVYPMEQVAQRWATKKPFTVQQKEISYIKILSLDILQAELAVAKVELKAGERLFIDYLSLYKTTDDWKIINKVFVEIKK